MSCKNACVLFVSSIALYGVNVAIVYLIRGSGYVFGNTKCRNFIVVIIQRSAHKWYVKYLSSVSLHPWQGFLAYYCSFSPSVNGSSARGVPKECDMEELVGCERGEQGDSEGMYDSESLC